MQGLLAATAVPLVSLTEDVIAPAQFPARIFCSIAQGECSFSDLGCASTCNATRAPNDRLLTEHPVYFTS